MTIESALFEVKQALRLALLLIFLLSSVTAMLGQTVDSAVRARQSILHLKTTLSLQGKLKAIDLSPDGRTLAISVGDAVQLWDLSNGEMVRTINGFQKLHWLYWSPDSKRLLMTHWENQSALWIREKPSSELGFPDFRRDRGTLLWSPDSKHVIETEPNNAFGVWNTDTRTIRFELKLKKTVKAWQWSPDGRTIMTMTRGGGVGNPKSWIQVWDAETGEQKYEIRVTGQVETAEFSADGKYILTVGLWEVPQLWDAATGNLRMRFNPPWCPGKNCDATVAQLSRDGRIIVVGGIYSKADVWDVTTGTHLATIESESRNHFVIGGLSPDGQLVAIYHERFKSLKSFRRTSAISLYDTRTGHLRGALTGATMLWSEDSRFVWSPDSQTLVTAGGSHSYQGKIWDVSTGTLRADIALIEKEGHALLAGIYFNDLDRLSFHPSLPLLLGTSNNYVKVWDPKTGELLQVVNRSSSLLSQNGNVMATISEGSNSVQIWEFEKE